MPLTTDGGRPPPVPVANQVAALRAADPDPLRRWLRSSPHDPDERLWLFVWHEVCTLAGRVVGRLVIAQGGLRHPGILGFDVPMVAGGPPREVAEVDDLARALADALDQPVGLDPHRGHALTTLQSLTSLPPGDCDAAVALLRHHTDLPVDLLAGRWPVRGPDDAHAEAERLAPLGGILADPARFRAHLQRGVASTSAPRRDLSRRLLDLDRAIPPGR